MNQEVFLKKLGENIRKTRVSKGMTQVELGDLCNFEKSSINRIEAGRTNPTALTLKVIADCLQVNVSTFFEI
jgi:transcriptional regulator with XRE-family HTH domain